MQIRRWEEMPVVLNVNQVCQLTGMSRPTVLKYLKDGTIPSLKLGHQWLVDKETLRNSLGRKD